MPFYEIEFPLTGLNSESVEAALLACGAISVTYLDRGDEPVLEPLPGEMRLWSDTLVRALFDDDAVDANATATLRSLATHLSPQVAAAARVRAVATQVWERIWLADWKSMQFGRRLWVCPTSAERPLDPEAVVVWLDPGLAFGTGTHPTTALCLETLDSLDLLQKSVVDYGCGSGILAIAALKLGARRAIGIDLDPQALLASRENAIRNGVSSALETQLPGRQAASADCVFANILALPLIELQPTLAALIHPSGELVLSGILGTQLPDVLAAYRPQFDIVGCTQRDEWCCVRARKRATRD
ncbi:MAG TPA: 50S ribosomal protein L11 methyltransferase [Steroidobacteraceae bacterium]|nr:50S ribosomal protein L11 methyltransferase [Steroidobacteraceae bacterium]